MRFGDKLKYLRNLHRYSQRDVEARTGLYQSKLSDWETGKVGKRDAQPTRAQLLALARLYNVSLEYLCDDAIDDPAAPTPPASLPEEFRTVLMLAEMMGAKKAIARLAVAGREAAAPPAAPPPPPPAPPLPAHSPAPPAPPKRGEKTSRAVPKSLKPEDVTRNQGDNDHDENENGGKKRRGRPKGR